MSGKVRAAPSASLTSSPQADRLHVAERSDARRTPSTDRRRGSEISARRERDKDDERSPKIERDADRSREAKGTGGRAASGTVREAVVERKYRLADAELVGPDELPVSMRRAGGAIVHSVLLDVQAPLYYQSAALLADLGYEAGAREALRSSGESSSSASASAPSLTWQAAEATLVSAASLAAQCSPLPDDLRLRVRASALPPAPPMEGGGAEEREGGAGRSAPLSGWLRLYAASAGKWRRLFFVLHSNRLLYFKKAPAALDDAPAPEGVLLLDERAFAKEVKALSPTPLLDTALAANKETRKLDAFVELRLSTAPVLLSLAEIEPPVRRQWLQRLSAQPRVFGARLAAFAAPPPLFLEMVEYLAAGRCVATEGLFRMSGSAARIERYVEQYNKGEAVDLAAERDPHTVAGLLRLWVRELQEPLLTEALYAEWIALARLQDARLQLLAALALVQRLPAVHRDCLARLFELFAQIVASESVNKMGVGNLATVFGANLLRVPAARAGDVGEAKAVNGVFVTLFDFHPHLFHRLPLPRRRAALLTAVALDAPHAADARANGLVGLAAGTELDVLLLPSPDATHLVATTRDALRAGLVPAASVAFLPRAKLPSWAEAQLQRSAARHAALVRERELLTRAARDPAAHSLYRSQLCARGDAWLARHPALRANVAALAAAAAALAKAQRQAESARRALEPVLEPAARAAAAAADVEREAAARAAAEALLQPAKEAAAPAARLPGLLGSLRGVLAGPVARATLHSRSFLSLAYAPPVPPVPEP